MKLNRQFAIYIIRTYYGIPDSCRNRSPVYTLIRNYNINTDRLTQ